MAERRRAPPPEDGTLTLIAMFLVGALLALTRTLWTPQAVSGLPVEVTGDVATPGLYLVDPPTLSAAVEAAGGRTAGVADDWLHQGDAVVVHADGARIVRMHQPLFAGAVLDLNHDDEAAIAVVPEVGPTRAKALVAQRAERPFRSMADVDRVTGFGPRQLPALAAVARARPPAPRIIDINSADAAGLESLPGVGPALAERIMADRAEGGTYRRLEDLDRVRGVGPALIDTLRPHVSLDGVRPAPTGRAGPPIPGSTADAPAGRDAAPPSAPDAGPAEGTGP